MKLIAKLLDIRFVYVMWAPLFWAHAKPGITTDLRRRRKDIDDDIYGPVFRIIPPLPFIFALAWEHLILYSTLPFKHTPLGAGPKSGLNEWRRIPFIPIMPIFLALYVTFLWLLQIHLLTWGITYMFMEEPVNLFSMGQPYAVGLYYSVKDLITHLIK
jgi:hypothetical protein